MKMAKMMKQKTKNERLSPAEYLKLPYMQIVVPEEDGTTCCYARSDKAWTVDPQGTRWETFHTFGSATTYYAAGGGCGDDKACAPQASARAAEAAKTGGACCGPDATKAACTVAAPIVAVAGASAAAAAHGCC